jgi:hypothetical protein
MTAARIAIENLAMVETYLITENEYYRTFFGTNKQSATRIFTHHLGYASIHWRVDSAISNCTTVVPDQGESRVNFMKCRKGARKYFRSDPRRAAQ